MIVRTLAFLCLNFGALGIGSIFTNPGVNSYWYQHLDKAPWTPPGWVFGAAWTSTMICLAVYMASGWKRITGKKLFLGLYAFQLLLNIGWNPVFFYYHNISLGLAIISALTLLVGYMAFAFYRQLKTISLLLLPYVVWLMIASSLNAYILFNN